MASSISGAKNDGYRTAYEGDKKSFPHDVISNEEKKAWEEGYKQGKKDREKRLKNSSFQNGAAKAEQEIQAKLQNAGVRVQNVVNDETMKAKGYKYKIELPTGMGEDLYSKDFNAAKEMAKEYGKGTKVTELK